MLPEDLYLVEAVLLSSEDIPDLLPLFQLAVLLPEEFIDEFPIVPELPVDPEPAVVAVELLVVVAASVEAVVLELEDIDAPVPDVVSEDALIPELADVLFVLRVLLQLASTIASGNTKNTFFITWSFCIPSFLIK